MSVNADILAQFGQARIGPGGPKYQNWYVEESKDNIYRIFPPMHKQRETGRWAVFHGKHWGYKATDKFSGKEVHRQFRCIRQKGKDKMVIVECPECALIDSKKALLETVSAAYKAEGKSDADIVELTKPITLWLKAHNVDNKFYLNVMNEKGEFGVLAIASKHLTALEELIKELKRTKPHLGDPIGVMQGLWFNFRRSGKGNTTQHTVTVVTEDVQVGGETLSKIKMAPLTEEQLKRGLEVLPELSTLVRVLTADQIATLAGGSGDPDQVAAIFNMAQKEASPKPVAPAPEVAVAPPPPVQQPPAPQQVVAPVDELAELRRKLAEAEQRLAAAPAPEKPVVVTPATALPPTAATTAAVPLSTLSDRDFLARYGGKK